MAKRRERSEIEMEIKVEMEERAGDGKDRWAGVVVENSKNRVDGWNIDSTIASDLHLHPHYTIISVQNIGFNWKSLVLWTICVIRNYMPLLYLV